MQTRWIVAWMMAVLQCGMAAAQSPPVARERAALQPAPPHSRQTSQFTPTARLPVAPLPEPGPGNDLEIRLRELEQQFEEQRFQYESLQQQFQEAQRAAAAPVERPARYRVGSDLNMSGVWNHGLEFRTPNRDFYFHVGGRTQFDTIGLNGTPSGLINTSPNTAQYQDAADFRRVRLRMEGSMYETTDWCVELNFVNTATIQDPTRAAPLVPGGGIGNDGSNVQILQNRTFNVVSPVDLWWNFRRVPVAGNVQLGNIKEPFNLERLESSRYLDFLERNFAMDAFVSPSSNGFAPGIMAWNWTENRRMTYALGVYKNVTNGNVFNIGDGQGEWAGRITYLPWYDEPARGRNFMHFGIGVCQRAIDNKLIRYRARGDLRNGPDSLLTAWADTGYIGGQYQMIVNPEFMYQRGPLFVQAEYTGNWTTDAATFPAGTGSNGAPPNGDPHSVPGATNLGSLYYWGGYCQVMYFLTGEHRIYDYQKGLVGRVVPYENAFLVRGRNGPIFGSGAWQIGYRLNYLDLNQKGVSGGTLLGHTVGLNWFFNPNSKLQFNFDIMERNANSLTANDRINSPGTGVQGFIYGFGTRFAADF
jgi:phosphate-selective porin OprO and OprP